jgi:hypothetical protein
MNHALIKHTKAHLNQFIISYFKEYKPSSEIIIIKNELFNLQDEIFS